MAEGDYFIYNRRSMENAGNIVVTCPKGIVPFLSREISRLGFTIFNESVAGVTTEGTLRDAQKLNLLLRTGHRVLYFLKDFEARSGEELYSGIAAIPWEKYIPEDGHICVASSVDTTTVRDSRYPNLKCKDAIVDRLRLRYNRRPDSGPGKQGAVVFLYWKDDRCSVYLDTSGEPLSKRGYRKIPLKAPMQETLAAAVVIQTGWDGENSFINPMCGSGTLAIEAALIGLNRAPGLSRDDFGFMHLKGFDRRAWEELRAQAEKVSREKLPGRIIATDRDPEAVAAARKNAEKAGVAGLIEFGTCDYAETVVPGGGGVVVINPEYGERMGSEKELETTYRGIGDFFKQKCRGYRGYIFTGNMTLSKMVGLRSRRRVPFFSGAIECRLLEYELYEGSRKIERGQT